MTLSSSVRASLEKATAEYSTYLPLAEEYLVGRGLDLDLAATRRLGVVVEPEIGHEAYQDRLSIPYLTRAGVVNMKFRCMADHVCKDMDCPKYLGLNLPTRMYNVRAFFTEDPYIAITEGEFDAMVLHDRAGIPAVSVPGVKNWKRHYERCFYDFERVFVFADNDGWRVRENCPSPACRDAGHCKGHNPGREFSKFVASALDGVTVIDLPEGMDVSDIYLAEGPDGLRKRAGL